MAKVKRQFQVLKQKVKPTLILLNSMLYVTKKVFLFM